MRKVTILFTAIACGIVLAGLFMVLRPQDGEGDLSFSCGGGEVTFVTDSKDVRCAEFGLRSITPAPSTQDVQLAATYNLNFTQPLSSTVSRSLRVTAQNTEGDVYASLAADSMVIDLPRTSLSFALDKPLPENTDIQLVVDGLAGMNTDTLQIKFEFATGASTQPGPQFTKQKIGDVAAPSSLTTRDNSRLYISSFTGQYHAVDLADDGTPTGAINPVGSAPAGYASIGIAFDPDNTSHIYATEWLVQGATDQYNAQLVRYDVDETGDLQSRTVVIDGLERHPNPYGDHGPLSIVFTNGKLYLSHGSATSGGDTSASFWGEPRLRESDVTAAILEIDYKDITDVINNRTFTFTADSSPARLYATGVRNAYDFVAHSNGRLYANVNQNGTSTDDGAAPTYGACADAPNESVDSSTIQDTLVQLEQGGYYGHPNESRGECIVLGGGSGDFRVPGYDSNVQSDPRFNPDLLHYYSSTNEGNYGRSVNGITEYLGSGTLRNHLLSADFAGSKSIIAVGIDTSAETLTVIDQIVLHDTDGQAITFFAPLDVLSFEGADRIYVADFGNREDLSGGAVYVLNP